MLFIFRYCIEFRFNILDVIVDALELAEKEVSKKFKINYLVLHQLMTWFIDAQVSADRRSESEYAQIHSYVCYGCDMVAPAALHIYSIIFYVIPCNCYEIYRKNTTK